MRDGEWGNPDRIGRERPTQPREGRSMSVMSDKEIRNKLLESDDPKGWKYSIGEQMRDNLTDDCSAYKEDRDLNPEKYT